MRYFFLVLVLFILILSYQIGRLFVLQKKSAPLQSASNNFSQDYYVGDSDNSPYLYIVLGDSTAVGTGSTEVSKTYPYKLAKSIADSGMYVHVINYAIIGATSGTVVADQIPEIVHQKPQLVSVTIGANDATQLTSKKEFTLSLSSIRNEIAKLQPATTLFATTPYMKSNPALPYPLNVFTNSRAKLQNSVLSSVVTQDIGIVNLYDNARLEKGQKPELYAADLFHPSDAGYAIWSDEFIKTFLATKGKNI